MATRKTPTVRKAGMKQATKQATKKTARNSAAKTGATKRQVGKARKAPAKAASGTATRKPAAKKAAVKKTTAKKAARKPLAKKTAVRKAAAKETSVKKTVARKAAARKPAASGTPAVRTAAPPKQGSGKAVRRQSPAGKVQATRAGVSARAGTSRKRKITPEQALANTRALLEAKHEHDRQPPPWQTLGAAPGQAPQPGFQSDDAAHKAGELHAGESRMQAIQGSIGTQGRHNQGKRDSR